MAIEREVSLVRRLDNDIRGRVQRWSYHGSLVIPNDTGLRRANIAYVRIYSSRREGMMWHMTNVTTKLVSFVVGRRTDQQRGPLLAPERITIGDARHEQSTSAQQPTCNRE